jgi:hypothetical protein
MCNLGAPRIATQPKPWRYIQIIFKQQRFRPRIDFQTTRPKEKPGALGVSWATRTKRRAGRTSVALSIHSERDDDERPSSE